MSTDWAEFVDAVDQAFKLSVYTSNELVFFIQQENGTGMKFRLDVNALPELIEVLNKVASHYNVSLLRQ